MNVSTSLLEPSFDAPKLRKLAEAASYVETTAMLILNLFLRLCAEAPVAVLDAQFATETARASGTLVDQSNAQRALSCATEGKWTGPKPPLPGAPASKANNPRQQWPSLLKQAVESFFQGAGAQRAHAQRPQSALLRAGVLGDLAIRLVTTYFVFYKHWGLSALRKARYDGLSCSPSIAHCLSFRCCARSTACAPRRSRR
jgi:hypothetical protein